MKKLASALLLSVTAGVASTSALAQDSTVNTGFYVGAKVGKMYIDLDVFEDPSAKAFMLGYDFGNFAVELERTTAEADWEYGGFAEGSADIDTTALYGVYRSSGTVYFKGKVGLLSEDVEDEDGESESDTGLSAGVGVGVRAQQFSFEAEYTILETDINLLSVGVHYTF